MKENLSNLGLKTVISDFLDSLVRHAGRSRSNFYYASMQSIVKDSDQDLKLRLLIARKLGRSRSTETVHALLTLIEENNPKLMSVDAIARAPPLYIKYKGF